MIWKHERKTSNSLNVIEIDDSKHDKESNQLFENNVIYFYKDVDSSSVYNLSQKIDAVSSQMRILQVVYNLPKPPPIHLHIHTYEGEIMSALALADKISSSEVPIYTYCEGLVASAGTLFSVVGAKRFITKNTCMLIHQLHDELWGNYEKLKDESRNVDLLMTSIKKIYKEKTKMEDSLIDEILKHDLYMSSDICLERGLVDKIL